MENQINDLTNNNKEVENYILKKTSWEGISKELRSQLITKKNWHLVVLNYSLKHQMRWKGNLISSIVPEERNYYIELVRKNMMNYLVN